MPTSPNTAESPRSPDLQRSAAWAGIIGPLLFVAVFMIEGWLRPGYQAASMFISALALGPRGGIQIANFVLLGLLFLKFAQGVAAEFSEGRASRLGPVLLTIIGFGFLASGPFVMDPQAVPWSQMTWHGTLHSLFGALVFSLAPVSCFVFSRRFAADPQWRWFRGWTVAVGVLMVAAIVFWKAGPTHVPAAPNAYNHWVGLIQRAALLPYLAWVSAFGLGLLKRAMTPAPATD